MVQGPNRKPETSDNAEDLPASSSTSTGTGAGAGDTACLSSDLSDCTKPYQPPSQCIETQTLANKTLAFQEKWFWDFPWLHYSPSVKGVLCFYCSKGFSRQSSFGQRADTAFISAGFRNWKKAIEKFSVHQNSQAHHHYVSVSAHKSNQYPVI